MNVDVLCGISKEEYLVDNLFLLLDMDIDDLHVEGVTLPGHQGYGSIFAHTISLLPYFAAIDSNYLFD